MTELIYRYRWIIVVSCLLTAILSALLIPGTKIDPEIRNYIPPSLKSSVETDQIEKEFGVQDMIMILFSDSTILKTDNLQQIKNIDRSISRISGVSDRLSPFTVKSITGTDGAMNVDPLIGRIPADRDGLRVLGKSMLENRFARDLVISSDLTSAAISATITKSEAENITLRKIDSVVVANPGRTKILKGGLPYIRQSIIKDVGKDVIILVPASLIIMLLILKLNLGSWRSVIMPFSVVVLTTALSLAMIPLCGWKISIITLLVPIILIAVANNYGIYIIARYQELRRADPEATKKELINLLLKSLNMPILFSGLTTVAGLLGLLAHSILPARQVGIIASAGVSVALFMSLVFIPALIFISKKSFISGHIPKSSTFNFERILKKLAETIIRIPGRILTISLVILIAISSGIGFLRVNTNQEEYFSRGHPVREASDLINSKFGGSQTISVMIEGDINDPYTMKRIDALTERLESVKGVGNVFSISQVVREMSKAIFTNTEYGYDRIPDSREALAQMFELYYMGSSQEDFRQLVNPENTKAQLTIRLAEPENSVIKSVLKVIAAETGTFPARVITGGYAIIMADFATSIIKGQISSLLFAIISVFLLLSLIFRSFKGGLIGSIPLIASILVLFGFMGYSAIALDAATALLSSIMIGVGVDFTIQYIWCFNLQLRKGFSYNESTVEAIKTIGRSIIINALSVMAGFSALVFSGFTSIRFFGYLVIISIGSCLIGALIIIPAFLVKYKPGFLGFEINNKGRRKNEKESTFIGATAAAFAGRSTTA